LHKESPGVGNSFCWRRSLCPRSGYTQLSKTQNRSSGHTIARTWLVFKLIIPGDWTVSANGKGRSWRVTFRSPEVRDHDVFLAVSVMVCSTAVNESAWADCRERDSHLADLYKDKVRSRKEIVVNGLTGERIETEEKYGRGLHYYARLSSLDRKYFLSGSFPKSFNMDRYAPVFDKMLASIRPVATQQVTTFKDARYSFSITYPDSCKQCPSLLGEERNVDEPELLRLAPASQGCSGPNVMLVSRLAKCSGTLLTGLQLQKTLLEGFTRVGLFLSSPMTAQGEREEAHFIRESYLFVNLLSTKDLLKIAERYEVTQKKLQAEAREILMTVNTTPK